jgi:hypothetical protein
MRRGLDGGVMALERGAHLGGQLCAWEPHQFFVLGWGPAAMHDGGARVGDHRSELDVTVEFLANLAPERFLGYLIGLNLAATGPRRHPHRGQAHS